MKNSKTINVSRIYYLLPPLMGMLAVATGAFGAHALTASIPAKNIEWWQTASNYLMYHSLASLFCIAFSQHQPKIKHCISLFSLGNILFCGSLFYMALTSNKALALLTPIGGLLYIVAWCYMLWIFLRLKSTTTS